MKKTIGNILKAVILCMIIVTGIAIIGFSGDNKINAEIDSALANETERTRSPENYLESNDPTAVGPGYVKYGSEAAEIYIDYQNTVEGMGYNQMNSAWVPYKLFADEDISLWCIEHGAHVNDYMTGLSKLYSAWKAGESAPIDTSYSKKHETNPYYYYGRNMSTKEGLISNYISDSSTYRGEYDTWASGKFNVTSFQGEDQDVIDANNTNMPGIGNNPYQYGLLYEKSKEYTVEEGIAELFVLTQKFVYDGVDAIPYGNDVISLAQKQRGYFTNKEKQAALWKTPLNLGANGNKEDRQLGSIANEYKKFYEKLHNGNGYQDFVKAYNVENNEVKRDEAGNPSSENIKETTTEIGGESYKTFQYQDTKIETNYNVEDITKSTYVIGPFLIDFTVDDDNSDKYEIGATGASTDVSTPNAFAENEEEADSETETDSDIEDSPIIAEEDRHQAEWKFNAIQKITVYNQNKVDIETLGGSFKIIQINSNNQRVEKKSRRIDEMQVNTDGTETGVRYYTLLEDGSISPAICDGKEVPAFDSNKPFYIVVERGTMRDEQFTNFYAKIDLQYLDSIDGTLYQYLGYKVSYGYKIEPEDKIYTYTGSYSVQDGTQHRTDSVQDLDASGNVQYNEDGSVKMKDVPCTHPAYRTETDTKSWTRPTYNYTLTRTVSDTPVAQAQLGYKQGWRIYKTYSIVLTGPDGQEHPEFRLQKVDADNNEKALYGAEFKVTFKANGVDRAGNKLNERIVNYPATLITDTNGLIRITSDEIKKAGLNLETFTGDLEVTYTEIKAPSGYILDKTPKTMRLKLENGKIKADTQENVEIDTEKNIATFTVKNKWKIDIIPEIQLTKVNQRAEKIREAFFEIQVKYTDNGKTVDKDNSIIRGQTENGVLYLTRQEFLDMNNGFDVANYTGTINLRIKEVDVSANNYSIKSEDMLIALEYENGKLKLQDGVHKGNATITYTFNNIYNQIYLYANGERNTEKVPQWLQNRLADWRQDKWDYYRSVVANLGQYESISQRLTDAKLTKLLKDYAEKAFDSDITKIVKEFTYESHTTTEGNKVIANIVIKDDENVNFKLPNWTTGVIYDPPTPEPEPVLMTIGGWAFLDQSTTKEGIESDGLLGEGETILPGIEVTLLKKSGSSWVPATLVQANGEARTNPTVTNQNGYYQFKGVDALGEYIVQFTYNGVKYTNTQSGSAIYNTADWEKTSKASEVLSEREVLNNKYSLITATKNAYNYDEIQSVYEEVARLTYDYIQRNNQYPAGMDNTAENSIRSNPIYSQVITNHPNDSEIIKKIQYIIESKLSAYAGYNSSEIRINDLSKELEGGMVAKDSNGTYPYYKKFMIGDTLINSGRVTVNFAGSRDIPTLYPGQGYINLGLKPRSSTDLSLKVDIDETTVSVNGQDTVYEFGKGLDEYSQNIYEEDYNNYKLNQDGTKSKVYDTIERYDSKEIAYYTENGMEYYMTYKLDVKNATSIDTAVMEIVDYYDKNFTFNKDGYTTTKGNAIPGIEVYLNGENKTSEFNLEVNTNSKYPLSTVLTENRQNTEHNMMFIAFNNPKYITNQGDKIEVRLTFKMDKGTFDTVNKNIYEHLKDPNSVWDIGNYAEINAYQTRYGHLDAVSKPGNFSIAAYKSASEDYERAYANYQWDPNNEEYRIQMILAQYNLDTVAEDDADFVNMMLMKNRYRRELSGNVWEAVSDEILSSIDLSNNDKYLTYDEAKAVYGDKINLSGIKVELLELKNDGTQVLRGATVTDENGIYKFTSYIPGKYVLRFIYGEYSDAERGAITRSKITTYAGNTDDDKDKLPITGAYYQSTKANPNTNSTKYWYDSAERDEEKGKLTYKDDATRYSDAYDDSYTRLSQMNAKINTNSEIVNTESDYDYKAIREIEATRHTDPIYAYTSTLEFEVEYVAPRIKGNARESYYTYNVQNIDFGITPRTANDLNIKKYVENIKIYLQDGTKKIDVTFDENGNILEGYDNIGAELIRTIGTGEDRGNVNYAIDGLIYIDYSEYQLQGATIEVKYNITVKNDSRYRVDRAENGETRNVYETIKYIKDGAQGKTISIAYYDENMEDLVFYDDDVIIYHNEVGTEYADNVQRSSKYTKIANPVAGEAEAITSGAKNIVDYVSGLRFSDINYNKESINNNWYYTLKTEFVSSRAKYENLNTGTDLLESYSSILRAKDTIKDENGNDIPNPIYKELLPGERVSDTLTLTTVLGSTGVDKDGEGDPTEIDLSGADYEFSNSAEVTRISNSAGRPIDLEGYEIEGNNEPESTSKPRTLADIDDGAVLEGQKTRFAPTLGFSKSELITIGSPTGLDEIENNIISNLWIVAVALSIFAAGVVLIKVYVVKPKAKA